MDGQILEEAGSLIFNIHYPDTKASGQVIRQHRDWAML